ncbi:hypothetical protein ABTJ91_20750, partial [Acinetobacter baumannii]
GVPAGKSGAISAGEFGAKRALPRPKENRAVPKPLSTSAGPGLEVAGSRRISASRFARDSNHSVTTLIYKDNSVQLRRS